VSISEKFDYVVVGSGASGAVVAARLSETGNTVCLLEAGPPDNHPFLHIPAGFMKVIFDTKYTWQFSTQTSDKTNGRQIALPQGRTLGGSTSINGLVYNRGQKSDFDNWAALGNEGWSYKDVLPYFKSMECYAGGDDEYRGRTGELKVSDIDLAHPICEAFIKGAINQGLPRTEDYNGASQEGVGYYQRTIHKGWRISTAKAFLKPVRGRKNLHVKTSAQVTRILFEGKRAVGVSYVHPSERTVAKTVLATKEVIIACGAINTPKLLQLSGIGPAALLKEYGIEVVQDLRGVGENLSDHYSVRVGAKVKGGDTFNELATGLPLGGQIARWLLKRPSILALSPSLVHWFWKSKPELSHADLQGVFSPASYKEGYVGRLDDFPGMTVGVWQHRPKSRGYVRIASSNPFDAPIIQPNYLEHPDDQKILVSGIKLARKLLLSESLNKYFDKETFPGNTCSSDDELLDFARQYGVSAYHLNGTAHMGPKSDENAVVDHKLRVYGVENLRIVDSAVMPSMPSANISAATMMIGNKASDLILED